MSTTVGVLVASYNRPRMLREALGSIVGADQIVLTDDGSDTFDPSQVIAELGIDASLVANPPMSAEARLRVPHMGRLYNRALATITCDVITYLCDDDVFAPGWLPAVRAFFDTNPNEHMVRGDWLVLDADPPRSAFPPGFPWALTTGNFAHRMECFLYEGCVWNEVATAVQDAHYLGTFCARHGWPHGGFTVPHAGALAGWRREHPMNLINYVDRLDFAPSAADVIGGYMEDGHAEGES